MLLFIVLPVIVSIVSAGFLPPPALTYTASAVSYPEVYGYAATPVVKAPAYHLAKSVPITYSVAAAPVIKAAPPVAYAPAPAYAAAPAIASAPAIAAAPPPAYAAYPATYGSYLR